jgi:hypothetical protein
VIDRKFPLGAPINRQRELTWVPNVKRGPGWWKHERTGEEKYVEPPKKESVDGAKA